MNSERSFDTSVVDGLKGQLKGLARKPSRWQRLRTWMTAWSQRAHRRSSERTGTY